MIKLHQILIDFLLYLSLLFLVLISPINSYFMNIVGLSFKIWLPFVIVFVLGIIFIILKSLFATFTKTTIKAGIISGLVVGVIFYLPIFILIITTLLTEPLEVSFIMISYLLVGTLLNLLSLLMNIFIGFIQSLLFSWYTLLTRKKIFILVLAVIFALSLLLFGMTIYNYNDDLHNDCPKFEFTLLSVAGGTPGCYLTAETKKQTGWATEKISELGVQFEYPKRWGELNFQDGGKDDSNSGKAFTISTGRYTHEMGEDRLIGMGATPDFTAGPTAVYDSNDGWVTSFNAGDCTFVAKKKRDRDTLTNTISLTRNSGINSCAGVEYLESQLGTIIYYHVPTSYPSIQRIEFSITPNQGIAIIPLQHPDYQLIFFKKLLNTPEKELEFKNFLQSFKPLS